MTNTTRLTNTFTTRIRNNAIAEMINKYGLELFADMVIAYSGQFLTNDDNAINKMALAYAQQNGLVKTFA